MTSTNMRSLGPRASASCDLGVRVPSRSRRRACALLAVLSITACKTPDHKTTVNKLTLPTTQTACVAAGGEWVEPVPETIVSGCFLKTKAFHLRQRALV
jgi:hypothetical protein